MAEKRRLLLATLEELHQVSEAPEGHSCVGIHLRLSDEQLAYKAGDPHQDLKLRLASAYMAFDTTMHHALKLQADYAKLEAELANAYGESMRLDASLEVVGTEKDAWKAYAEAMELCNGETCSNCEQCRDIGKKRLVLREMGVMD